VQPGLPTHGYDGPIKVSSGAYQTGIFYEFIQVGTTYHKRQYADDTDDLETCNTYSVSYDISSLSATTNQICLSRVTSESLYS
jgi:alcohol oxidase